jgi:hypothetical protein
MAIRMAKALGIISFPAYVVKSEPCMVANNKPPFGDNNSCLVMEKVHDASVWLRIVAKIENMLELIVNGNEDALPLARFCVVAFPFLVFPYSKAAPSNEGGYISNRLSITGIQEGVVCSKFEKINRVPI